MKAFDKINHTLCMNSDTISFNLSEADCKDIDDMADSLADVEKAIEAFDIIKPHLSIERMEDAACLCIDGIRIMQLTKEEYGKIKEALHEQVR